MVWKWFWERNKITVIFLLWFMINIISQEKICVYWNPLTLYRGLTAGLFLSGSVWVLSLDHSLTSSSLKKKSKSFPNFKQIVKWIFHNGGFLYQSFPSFTLVEFSFSWSWSWLYSWFFFKLGEALSSGIGGRLTSEEFLSDCWNKKI